MRQAIKLLVATTFVTVAFLVAERSLIAQPDWVDGCGGTEEFCGVAIVCDRGGGPDSCDTTFYERDNRMR